MSRNPLLLVPLAIFATLAAIFLRALSSDPQRLASTLIGNPVPTFSLPAVEGLGQQGLSSNNLTQGQVTLVNIWASWCGPCREEHPTLMQLKAQGIRIVGINNKDLSTNAVRFLSTLGNPYQAVGADHDGRITIDWGGYGVPESFIIDAKGIVQHKHVGPLRPIDLVGKFGEALKAAAE